MSIGGHKLVDIKSSRDFVVNTVVLHRAGVELKSFTQYCEGELTLLKSGLARETWQSQKLCVQTSEELEIVVNAVRDGQNLTRPELRAKLAQHFPTASAPGLNRSVDLALRFWLVINFREVEDQTLRHESVCVVWDDDTTLKTFVNELFPTSKLYTSNSSNHRFGRHFTADFLTRVCGLKIEWTTSLCDHLQFDRYKNVVRIFPYKSYLHHLLQQPVDSHPISRTVLQEILLWLDILFPIWDQNSMSLLHKESQDFQEFGPVSSSVVAITAEDFDHWRDRLLELREALDAPPVSWAQLWRDRRSPQQFWTFWIALVILLLTVVSCIASLMQAWASVMALQLAQMQARQAVPA